MMQRRYALVIAAGMACASSVAQASGFAVVDSNGSLVRGTAVSSSRTATGNYSVVFNHSVKACVYTATTGSTAGGTPANAFVTVARSSTNPDAVAVATYDPAGNAANFSFHLNLRC
jgi:hypothetical protein